jgi:hypothetical protein
VVPAAVLRVLEAAVVTRPVPLVIAVLPADAVLVLVAVALAVASWPAAVMAVEEAVAEPPVAFVVPVPPVAFAVEVATPVDPSETASAKEFAVDIPP